MYINTYVQGFSSEEGALCYQLFTLVLPAGIIVLSVLLCSV